MKNQVIIFIFAALCFVCGYIVGHNQGYKEALEVQISFSENN